MVGLSVRLYVHNTTGGGEQTETETQTQIHRYAIRHARTDRHADRHADRQNRWNPKNQTNADRKTNPNR